MTTAIDQWLEVDRAGLAQIVRRRGSAFLALELLSNAWDTKADRVTVTLETIAGKPLACLIVEDNDPTGFEDLTDAFTLYRHTKKRRDPGVRGRFNIGEKEVLALCKEARIISTTGAVVFKADGTRRRSKDRTEKGSRFEGIVRLTHAETREALAVLQTVIPPAGIVTQVNCRSVDCRKALSTFSVQLPTELEDDEGNFRPTKRMAEVRIYEPEARETSTLYEMGIPVCEIGDDRWHIDVQQKIPMPRDRDAVRPSYLHKLRVAVLNHMHDNLNEDDAAEAWVSDALEDEAVDAEAVSGVLTSRYGDKRVIADPADPEATKRAASEGYAVIHGGAFGKTAWKQIKETEAVKPAGQVFPTSNPEFDPDGQDASLPDTEWTDGMRTVSRYAKTIGKALLGTEPVINIVRDPFNRKFQAWYGGERLTFNLLTCGHKFFNEFPGNMDEINDLLIHEFGHNTACDHLSSDYHKALCHLGAKLTRLALDEPELFSQIGGGE